MDKYKEFAREYEALKKIADPFIKDDPDAFLYFIENVLLRVWSGNGRYSEDYAKAIEAISGQRRTGKQILEAMIRCRETGPVTPVPDFYARMVDRNFDRGMGETKAFVEGFKSLIVGGACINGDFTIEESDTLSAEIKNLMTYAVSKGVKVDYASGRIRERTTPLNEESYTRNAEEPDEGTGLSGEAADLIFQMTDETFLKPAQLIREEAGGPQAGARKPGGGSEDDPWKTGGEAEDSARAEGGEQSGTRVPVTVDERTMEELMAELDGLVGLESIKKDIHSLMNFIQITKLREERGLTVPTISYHLVFTGNPGTGKTTVARLVAGLYRQIGILPKGQLVEVDRGALVAGYTGQTAIKTGDVIKQALGGVLFIDEAYALVNDDQDSFGKEAVETLLKAMEDHRKELVVIVAGYTELMHRFIESNPGFKSRFSKFFEFPDYTGEELMEIFLRFCGSNGYTLDEEAKSLLTEKLNEMYENRSRHFGNGRTVRNIFEKAIHRQADRLTAGKATESGKAPADGDGEKTGNSGENPEGPAQQSSPFLSDQDLATLTAEDLRSALEEEARKDRLTKE